MKQSIFSNTYTLSVVARKLGIGRKELCALLRRRGIFQHGTIPRQQYIDRGYFIPKEKRHHWSPQLYPYTLVTYKGFVWLRNELAKLTLAAGEAANA